jgi:hypothetical protein
VSALKADNTVRLVRQQIDDFAFAFITPLGADNNYVFSHLTPSRLVSARE